MYHAAIWWQVKQTVVSTTGATQFLYISSVATSCRQENQEHGVGFILSVCLFLSLVLRIKIIYLFIVVLVCLWLYIDMVVFNIPLLFSMFKTNNNENKLQQRPKRMKCLEIINRRWSCGFPTSTTSFVL